MLPEKIMSVTAFVIALCCYTVAAQCATDEVPSHFIAEAYPAKIEASKQSYSSKVSAISPTVKIVPFYLIVPKLQRWAPGKIIKVAFRGGMKFFTRKLRRPRRNG